MKINSLIKPFSLLIAVALTPSVVMAQGEIAFPHLMINGTAQLEVAADMATVRIELTQTAKDALNAKKTVSEVQQQLLKEFTSQGIAKEAVEVTALSIQENYVYNEKKQKQEKAGYRANQQLSVKVFPLTQLDSIINAAISHSTVTVSSIQLGIHNPAEIKQKVRQLALENAQQSAQEIAKGFKQNLGAIWEIQYQNVSPIPVQYVQPRTLMAKSANLGAQQDAGQSYQAQIQFNDNVNVVYKLRQ